MDRTTGTELRHKKKESRTAFQIAYWGRCLRILYSMDRKLHELRLDRMYEKLSKKKTSSMTNEGGTRKFSVMFYLYIEFWKIHQNCLASGHSI